MTLVARIPMAGHQVPVHHHRSTVESRARFDGEYTFARRGHPSGGHDYAEREGEEERQKKWKSRFPNHRARGYSRKPHISTRDRLDRL